MDLRLTEEQEMLKTSARDFIAAECPKSKVRAMEEDETGHDPALWKKMAALGWTGLLVPEEYEGMGLTFQDGMALIEEMGRNIVPGPYLSTLIATFPVLLAGTEAQKKDLLPRVARGEVKLTLASLEPSGQMGPGGVTMTANEEPGYYVLNGTKMFVEMANVADYLVCPARTSRGKGEDGISLFLVDARSKGIESEVIPTIGMDKLCEVRFKDVHVPQGNLLGEKGKGWAALKDTLRKAALVRCADSVGGMQASIDMTVAYVKDRVQYERPVGAFQAVQHLIADTWTAMQTARYLVYEAIWLESTGQPSDREASMAKAYTGNAYKFVSKWAIRLHGGIGTSREHDISLYYRRAKAADIAWGAADYHHELVAEKLGLLK